MKKLLTLPLLALSCAIMAQGPALMGTAQANLDVSNINPKILMGGDMFWNLSNAAFEVPRGSGKHTIFSGALWVGGLDAQNNLYVAQQTYRQGTPADAGYWPGPISNINGNAHSAAWDKIWKVSKADIQNHAANYNSAGYSMPVDIATWPGNGNTAIGEAAQLAPFADLNSDGIYQPAAGEYPEIKGDQALYLILNDAAGIKEPASPAMGLEVHAMYYGFDNPADQEIYNTIFTEYRLINRGSLNLLDVHAGIWLDLDLGNWNDDYIGCDTLTNRFFAYNGDNDDEGAEGYGINPPVQSCAFVDRQMTHFIYYNNDFSDQGNPSASQHYYNFLRGIWKNNQPMTYGGDGFTAAPGGISVPVNYMFPGDPVTQSGWTENHTLSSPTQNMPADRRGLGSIGPFSLAPGVEYDFTVAYNYSRSLSVNSITQAQNDAVTIQNDFNILNATASSLANKTELYLQPNPATEVIRLQIPGRTDIGTVTVRITDLTGREMLQFNPTLQAGKTPPLNINSLSAGVYLVSVTSGGKSTTAKLVKL